MSTAATQKPLASLSRDELIQERSDLLSQLGRVEGQLKRLGWVPKQGR